ncbi:hypothetical protein MRB53_009733 [Persea americana]|uniref:Uncharacterized protein n=1 Tax=Persea americana TaxID=3435 RepID=A0ACC2LR10_PERAE|nr:hypothetical protein MRB53_009733 [Persea americana]
MLKRSIGWGYLCFFRLKSFKPIVKREDARQSSERTKLRPMQEKLKQMTIEKEKAEALLKEQEKATISLSKQLEEMQEKFKRVSFDTEKTQEILKEKDKMLNRKDEQLENLGKKQEKIELELNRLRKLKEFKPTLSSYFFQEEVENKACLQKKKPSSAYMLWRKDQWNQVKKENPGAQLKDICNILGMKWKNLSAKEKKPYEEKHLAEKEFCLQIIRKESEKKRVLIKEEQHQKAAVELLEEYLLFRKEIDKESKRTRTERDPSKPKQPLSAFFLFLSERQPALLAEKKNAFEVKINPTLKCLHCSRFSASLFVIAKPFKWIIWQIAKIAGEEWRNMNEEKQVPYKEVHVSVCEN